MTSTTLHIRVIPRSGRDEVIGWPDGVLRMRVRAAPVDGQANEAICRFIAKAAGLPSRAVTLVSGQTSRSKTLRIEGLTADELESRLS